MVGHYFKKAIIEHNLIAASKLYNNVTLANLAVILNVDVNGAESITANMIAQNRLAGFIDQTNGILHFASANILQNWDSNIENICTSVNAIFDKLNAEQPKWMETHLQPFI